MYVPSVATWYMCTTHLIIMRLKEHTLFFIIILKKEDGFFFLLF
jgi:hypothetical protein